MSNQSMGVGGVLKKKLKIDVQMAKQIRDILTTGTFCSRDVVFKGHNVQKLETPRDVPDRGHNVQGT